MKYLIGIALACCMLMRAHSQDAVSKKVFVGRVLARQFGVADMAPITEGQEWVPLLVSVSQRVGPKKYIKIRYDYWPLSEDGKELPFDDSSAVWRFEAVRDRSCDGTLGDMRFIEGTPAPGVKPHADERIPALIPFKGFSRKELSALPDNMQLECYTVTPEDARRLPAHEDSNSRAPGKQQRTPLCGAAVVHN